MIRSLSTSAFGQPSETKPTLGARDCGAPAPCASRRTFALAFAVIETGTPEPLSFGIADETAWRAGLACGGKIRVHVSKLDPKSDLDFLKKLDDAAAAREPIVITTRLSDGVRQIYDGNNSTDPA